MPEWTHEPPPEDSLMGIRLIRTPASGKLQAVILSDDVIGCPTHYDGTRTLPCSKDKCDACARGLPWRWHGYIGLWIVGTQERVVLELTAAASQRLVEHRKQYKTLRGFDLIACRPRGKPNSRIHVALGAMQRPSSQLPPAPDVQAIMCYIWGYDPSGVQNNRNIIGRQEFKFPTQKAKGNGDLTPTLDGIGRLPPE